MESLIRAQPIKYLIKMQAVVLVITSVIAFFIKDGLIATAYLYGGGIAVFNTLLQIWHITVSAKLAKADAGKNLGRAYRCVAERWIMTIVLFAIGFQVLETVEMMLVGFVVMQMVVLFGNYRRA